MASRLVAACLFIIILTAFGEPSQDSDDDALDALPGRTANAVTDVVISSSRAALIEASGISTEGDSPRAVDGGIAASIIGLLVYTPDITGNRQLFSLHKDVLGTINGGIAALVLVWCGVSIIAGSLFNPDPSYREKAIRAIFGVALANVSLELVQAMVFATRVLTIACTNSMDLSQFYIGSAVTSILLLALLHAQILFIFAILAMRAAAIALGAVVSPLVALAFCIEETKPAASRAIKAYLMLLLLGPLEGLALRIALVSMGAAVENLSLQAAAVGVGTLFLAIVMPFAEYHLIMVDRPINKLSRVSPAVYDLRAERRRHNRARAKERVRVKGKKW